MYQKTHLDVQFSPDLKWCTHINNITKRASSILGFLRRNLRNCPHDCRCTAYLSLVRSTLEYGSIIWDLRNQADIDPLELIKHHAACFIVGDYRSREPVCSINKTSPPYRTTQTTTPLFFHKVVGGLGPGIPVEQFLKPLPANKRQINGPVPTN